MQDEVVGLAMAKDIVATANRPEAEEAVRHAVGGEDTDELVVSMVTKSGKDVAVSVDAGPRKSGADIIGSMVLGRALSAPDASVSGDGITELLDLLDKLGIAAWLTDREGTVDDCNKAACKILEKEQAPPSWLLAAALLASG